MSEFTDFLSTKRRKKRVTLRSICAMTGISPVDYSLMEAGVIPPIMECIGIIASKLGLSKKDESILETLALESRRNWKPTDRKFQPAFIEFSSGRTPTGDDLEKVMRLMDGDLPLTKEERERIKKFL